jgi:hypothetical protein
MSLGSWILNYNKSINQKIELYLEYISQCVNTVIKPKIDYINII